MTDHSSRPILIVDDLLEQREIYTALFRSNGFTVIEAVDGREAVALAAERRPQAILMDVVLPVLNGWEAIRRLRADPVTAGIPVVVISARATAEDVEESRTSGANAHLSKPCEPQLVLQEIRKYTEGGGET